MEIVTENATSLAWIGDAVMSLAVREHLLSLGFRKAHVLQKKNAVICSAKGQNILRSNRIGINAWLFVLIWPSRKTEGLS